MTTHFFIFSDFIKPKANICIFYSISGLLMLHMGPLSNNTVSLPKCTRLILYCSPDTSITATFCLSRVPFSWFLYWFFNKVTTCSCAVN